MLEATRLFSGKAEVYAKSRPGYPKEIFRFLQNEKDLQLAPGRVVADVGSGTGIFSRQLLEAGYDVYAVEPNPDMRDQAELMLQGSRFFHSVNGTAETTGLDSNSIDFITCAQAFHWFRPQETREEFSRILKPGGWVILIWNGRSCVEAHGLERDLDNLLEHYRKRGKVQLTNNADEKTFQEFFAPFIARNKNFPHTELMNQEALRSLVLSRSYSPKPGEPEYEDAMAEADLIFNRYQINGLVAVPYVTEVTYGQLK